MHENLKEQHHYLSDYLSGRDNNFNIIRMIAASSVLVSHSYPLTRGVGTAEPLDSVLEFSLGLFVAVTLCSIVSWHLIEKPALQLKNLPILSVLPFRKIKAEYMPFLCCKLSTIT